ncbi:MAG: sulfite exporter TauE/SafE family protein [Candidatus Levybacteria bacterium]|nr:sulfite exporter TauE/SafE family protein [Candidatus Levybacteria bacterium]
MEFIFFFAAFLSEIAGTIAGFGSSTIFLPLAVLFVDFKTALTLVAAFHVFGNLGRIGFFKHGLDKHMLITFGIPSVAFTILGALLVSYIPQELLKGMLGIFLVVYAALSLWKEGLQVKPSLPSAMFGGGASGFLAGLIGTGGALRGALLTAFGLPKEKYIATSAAIALAVDITRIPVYISQGFLKEAYYWYIPVLLLVALLGSFTGKQTVNKIPQKQFRKVVLGAIFVIGLKFIFDLTRLFQLT